MGVPHQIHLLLLLYQPAFAVLRPRVGSTFTRPTFVPSVQSQNCWGWLIKLKNTSLLGAESYLGWVVRISFPRYFRSPYKFVPISLFYPSSQWGFGSAED